MMTARNVLLSGKWPTVLLVSVLLAVAAQAADFKASSFSDIGNIKRKVLAAHFLMRTTFGPRTSDIDALALRIKQIGKRAAFEEWIDDQLNDYPLSSDWQAYQADRGRIWPLAKKMLVDMGYEEANFGESPGAPTFGVHGLSQWKEHAWWHRVITADDQLRQRMAWALSQIFVTAEGPAVFGNRNLDTSANPRWLALAKYYDDVCVTNAFGNYRDLLDSVTFHPVMGVWLSSVLNKKADPVAGTEPDENYAREVMQLFSIGLVEMQTNGVNRLGADGEFVETYDNETIRALARVFTGMAYDNNDPNTDSFNAGGNLHFAMEMVEQEHDTGQKVAFGGALVIPARTESKANALQDISDVHDFLAFEHDNTAPFICRRLIQRLVMSNPPKSYLRRVARAFNRNKTNPAQFKEVLKAILLDKVALRALSFQKVSLPPGLKVRVKYPTERTRLREPVLRYTALFREFSPYPDPSFVTDGSKVPFTTPGGAEGSAGNQYFFIDNDSSLLFDNFSQAPYQSETVFNFYQPDYQSPGDISDYVPTKSLANGQLFTPEFQIMTPVTANETTNEYRRSTIDDDMDAGIVRMASGAAVTIDINFDFSRFYRDGGTLGVEGTETTLAQLEDFVEALDLLFCAGTMSSTTKQVLLDVCLFELNAFTIDIAEERQDIVQAVLGVVMGSPDSAVIP